MKCPVALFAYRRPEHLRRVVEGLQVNAESPDTDLYIFCDAAKGADDAADVASVRAYAKTVSGFRTVTIVERQRNYGLSKSITDGVTMLCDRYGKVSVVEDDVLVSQHFMAWVNSALDKYQSDQRVISIGCYVFPCGKPLPKTFFLNITDCWGWAVWKRSWDFYESDGALLLDSLLRSGKARDFDLNGAYPYIGMLRDQIAGRNDSWAVRWYASAVLSGGLTIYPGQSMTANIGFDGSGVHCGVDAAYQVNLSQEPIKVEDIPVEESLQARLVWSDFLKQQRSAGSARSCLSSFRRWVRNVL